MATKMHIRFSNICLFGLWKSLAISAYAKISAYSDSQCKDLLENVQTNLVAVDGDCIALPKGTHSVKTITVDNRCGVTAYPDYCGSSGNTNATLAPPKMCKAMSEMFTLSVDCAGLSAEASRSTESIESTIRAKSNSHSSTVSSEGISRSRSSSDRPSALDMTASSPTSTSFFTGSASSLTRDRATLSTSLKPRPSSTPSPAPTKSGRNTTDFSNNNLSKDAQIVIGVVVPALALMAAVIFGIRAWNHKYLVAMGPATRTSSEEEETEKIHNATTEVTRSGEETLKNSPHKPEIQLPPSHGQGSPDTPFPIPSTSLKLYTFSYGHAVPYPAFSTTLLTALDDLLQSALEGQIHEQDPIPTTVSEWNEDGTSLYVQGKGLTMADLSSALRGLGQYAQKWRFDQHGISGIWTVEQVGTGRRCDLMVSRASSKE
ncbi:hypothetical protein G7Y79_00026g059490 [Physcia stellaris]|nr:hypothetical protein G7Y79_00026g059490 [Physcia stellaris]